MKILRRIIKNVKWAILNHPPTTLTAAENPVACSYCKANNHSTYNFVNSGFAICEGCIKTMCDNALSYMK